MKSLLKILITICFSFLIFGQVSAQVIVAKKPQKPKIAFVKTTKPSPNHKWIDGHWKVRNNQYTWSAGYWVKAHKHDVWVPGHWKRYPSGWKWIPGHWKNLRR